MAGRGPKGRCHYRGSEPETTAHPGCRRTGDREGEAALVVEQMRDRGRDVARQPRAVSVGHHPVVASLPDVDGDTDVPETAAPRVNGSPVGLQSRRHPCPRRRLAGTPRPDGALRSRPVAGEPHPDRDPASVRRRGPPHPRGHPVRRHPGCAGRLRLRTAVVAASLRAPTSHARALWRDTRARASATANSDWSFGTRVRPRRGAAGAVVKCCKAARDGTSRERAGGARARSNTFPPKGQSRGEPLPSRPTTKRTSWAALRPSGHPGEENFSRLRFVAHPAKGLFRPCKNARQPAGGLTRIFCHADVAERAVPSRPPNRYRDQRPRASGWGVAASRGLEQPTPP